MTAKEQLSVWVCWSVASLLGRHAPRYNRTCGPFAVARALPRDGGKRRSAIAAIRQGRYSPIRIAPGSSRFDSVREVTPMSVDAKTVSRVAHLARIALPEGEVARMQGEINAMLGFVEQLNEVDVEGVEPMTSVMPMVMKKRADLVTDGGIAAQIVQNAPQSEDDYFMVPKVVE
jgi:aspartyl-tRNA(Asn)/glutamyl-tRNA(Gln) amidotransferase subunit C